MTPEQFLKEFNTFVNAPNGIQQLRNLILGLAVEGEFDEYDASDEDVASLLEDIHTQREDLLAKRIIRKERSPSALNELEKPFEINKNWVWTRLGDLAWPLSGFAFKSEYFNDQGIGKAIIRIGDLSQTKDQIYYSGEFDPRYLVNKGEYLVGMSGDFKVAQWQSQVSLLNQRVARLIFFDKRINRYFVAMSLQMRLSHLHKGYSFTTLKNLSLSDLCDSVIALPPLEEQERIVARVDELMKFCDRLEEQQQAAKAFTDELRVSTFHHMVQSEKPEDAHDALQILVEDSALLLTKPEDVGDLRKLVLDLAVTGKLVDGKEGDSAYGILENLELTKDKTELEKFIKKYGPRPDLSEGNELIPEGWANVRFVDIGIWSGGSGFPKKFQGLSGLPYSFCKVSDLSKFGNGKYLKQTANTIDKSILKQIKAKLIDPGTVIFPKIGGAIATNRRSIITSPSVIDNNLLGITPFEGISPEWLYYLLQSIDMVKYQKSGPIPALAQGTLNEIIFGLPPLEEQERIVARVDELMELCDQLEAKLSSQVELADEYVTASAHALVS